MVCHRDCDYDVTSDTGGSPEDLWILFVTVDGDSRGRHTRTTIQGRPRSKLVRIRAANCIRLVYADIRLARWYQLHGDSEYRDDENENMGGVCKNAKAMCIEDLHHETDWTSDDERIDLQWESRGLTKATRERRSTFREIPRKTVQQIRGKAGGSRRVHDISVV
jgi:hypothetical protein